MRRSIIVAALVAGGLAVAPATSGAGTCQQYGPTGSFHCTGNMGGGYTGNSGDNQPPGQDTRTFYYSGRTGDGRAGRCTVTNLDTGEDLRCRGTLVAGE